MTKEIMFGGTNELKKQDIKTMSGIDIKRNKTAQAEVTKKGD